MKEIISISILCVYANFCIAQLGFTSAFDDPNIPNGGNTTLTFTIDNSSNPYPITDLAFENTLPQGLEIIAYLGGNCGGTGGVNNVFYFLEGGNMARNSICEISLRVQGNTDGEYNIVTGDLTSIIGNSGPSSATLKVTSLTPPTFTSSFNPSNIAPNNVSTLEFNIDNTNSEPVLDLDFINVLPVGMTISDPPVIVNSCTGGTLTATAGTSYINYTEGSVGGNSSCNISVKVTSATPGTTTNTSGDLTSCAGNSGTTSSNITVNTNAPSFSKSFSPSSVLYGERSTLTFTIDNNSSVALNSIQFIDNLPTGMVVASPPNISNSCTNGLLTATPGSGIITYNPTIFGQQSINAMSSCNITVDVIPNASGNLENVTNNFTSWNNLFQVLDSGLATAELNVQPLPAVSISKKFGTNPVNPGGTTNIEFTLRNLDRDYDATNISFTDDLDAMLSGTIATGPPISNSCGSSSSLTGTSLLSFTNGTIPAQGECVIVVEIITPPDATIGSHTNTTGAITGDINGVSITGNQATEMLFVEETPTFTKTFLNDPILGGGTTTLEYTITNNSLTETLTDLTFNDNISGFINSSTVSNIPASGDCGAGSIFFTPFVLGELNFSMLSGTIAAGSSCTFTIEINIPEVNSGVYQMSPSTLSGNIGSNFFQSESSTDELTVNAIPKLSIDFLNDPVNAGDIVDLEFTLSYDDGAVFDATAINFTNDLNAVIPGLAAVGLPLNDVCGTGSSISGTSNLTFSGGTMSPGDNCTFTVSVQTPTTVFPGTYTNTTSNITSTVDGLTGSANSTSDNLNIGGFEFTKEFIDGPYLPGELATLRYTINNTSTFDATNIFFSDNLSSALFGMAAEAPLPTPSCGGLIGGTTFLIYNGGFLPAGTSCTFDVNVRIPASANNGTYSSATSSLSTTMSSANLVLNPANDQFTVNNELIQLTKSFLDDPVTPGDPVTLEYSITNLDPTNVLTNISFTDDLDNALTGLVATGLPLNDICGSGSSISGADLINFSSGSIAPGGTCTFSVTLDTPSDAEFGSVINSFSSALTGEISGINVTGTSASDDLEFQFIEFSSSFSAPVFHGETGQLTFTIENISSNTVTDLQFLNNLDNTLAGLVASNLPLNDVCGTGSSITGGSTIVMTNGELGPNSSCSFTIDVDVPLNVMPGKYTNTTSPLVSNGLTMDDPTSADLDVFILPTFEKSFNPSYITTADISTLLFTITNPNPSVDAEFINLTNNLPIGLVLADIPNLTTTCTGGLFSGSAGSSTVSYTGGSLSMASSCIVSVDVQSDLPNTYVSTSNDLTSSLGNSGAKSATLIVDCPISTAEISGSTTLCQFEGPTPEVLFTYTGGIPPYVFEYSINNGPVQTITSVNNTTTIVQTTNDAGIYNYELLSAYDSNGCTASNLIDCSTTITDCAIMLGNMDNTLSKTFYTSNAQVVLTGECTETLHLSFDDDDITSNEITLNCSDIGFQTYTIYLWRNGMTIDSCSNLIQLLDGAGFCVPTEPNAVLNIEDLPIANKIEDSKILKSNTRSVNNTSVSIIVNALPTITFNTIDDLCIDSGVQTVFGTGNPIQGTEVGDIGFYSGNGILDLGDGLNYNIDPEVTGLGLYDVEYTYTDGNGCASYATTVGNILDECQTELCDATNVYVGQIIQSTYRAKVDLESDAVLSVGQDILFTAEQMIDLNAGFQVPLGAIFEGAIDLCISSPAIINLNDSTNEQTIKLLKFIEGTGVGFEDEPQLTLSIYNGDNLIAKNIIQKIDLKKSLQNNISQLSKGKYILKVSGKNTNLSQTLIIED